MHQSDQFKRIDSMNSFDSQGKDVFMKKLIQNAQLNWSAIMNNPNQEQSQYQSFNQDANQNGLYNPLDSQYQSQNSNFQSQQSQEANNQIRTKTFTFSNQKLSEPPSAIEENNKKVNLMYKSCHSYLAEISQLTYNKQVYDYQLYGVFFALDLISQIDKDHENQDDLLRTLENLQFSKYQIPSDALMNSKIYLWDPKKVVILVKEGKMLKSVLTRQVYIQGNKFIQTGKEKKEIPIEFNQIVLQNKNEIIKNSILWVSSKEQLDYRLLLNSNNRCFALYFHSYEESNRAKDYILINHQVQKHLLVLKKTRQAFSLTKRTFFSIFFKIQLEQLLDKKLYESHEANPFGNLGEQFINQTPFLGKQSLKLYLKSDHNQTEGRRIDFGSSNQQNEGVQQYSYGQLETQIKKIANEYLNFLFEDARQIEEMSYEDILTRQNQGPIKFDEQDEDESYDEDSSQQNIQEVDEEDDLDDQSNLAKINKQYFPFSQNLKKNTLLVSNFQSSSIAVDDDEEMPKINFHDTNSTSQKQHHSMFIRQHDLLKKKIH